MTHSFNRLTTIAALDIGSSKVCCVIAKISRDKRINVVGYGYNASKGIKNGIVTDINQATLSVCNAVETAEQMANERVSRIIVNISGDRVKSSIKRSAINLNKSKPVSEADIKKVIEKGINKINVENNELIHCLPTGYRLDFGEETNDPRNLYGESLSVDVLLGLVPEIMYRNVKTVLDNSHLEIAEKALSSYASGLACLVDDEKELGATVVDIGGGTTDIAVISLSGVVESASIKVAGDQFNEAIVKYMRRKHNVLVGERTAEMMKMEIGCVFPKEQETSIEIKGRCLMTGLPKVITVTSTEMLEAFEEPVERILEAVHGVLERTPPELVADISNNGIVMTGGGSLVDGFDRLIEARTGIHTVVAESAISCVAEGTGKSLDSLNAMTDGTVNLSRRRQMN